MMAIAALVSSQFELRNTIKLVSYLRNKTKYTKELRILLEYALIPCVDDLKINDLMVIFQALKSHSMGKTIFYDLLGAEFSRKSFNNDQTPFHTRA